MNKILTLLRSEKRKNAKFFETGAENFPESRAEDSAPLVLVVESDDLPREQLCRIIGSRYRLMVAYNASTALESLYDDRIPDAIVCDSVTSSMSGCELCSRLKDHKNLKHIPFIMLCDGTNGCNRLASLQNGADSCLSKPIRAEEVLYSIRNLLNTRIDVSKLYDSPAIAERESDADLHPKDRKFMHTLTGLILQEISNPELNVNMIARKMGYSRTGLFTRIKGITGMCPNEFIKDFRFKMASQMILDGNHSLQMIAEETGFSSNSYFSKAFKKRFGVSPKDYRG